MLFKFIRSASKLLIGLALATSLGGSPACGQETSLPGAVGPDGNFFVLQEHGNDLQIWEWNNNTHTWRQPQLGGIGSITPHGVTIGSRPAGRTPTGGFHAVVKDHFSENSLQGLPVLIRWEPVSSPVGSGVIFRGFPRNTTTQLSEPSEYFSNRYICTVEKFSRHGFTRRSLLQVDTLNGTWTEHEAPAKRLRSDTPVSVLNPTQFFMANLSGKLIERWYSRSGWKWVKNRSPDSKIVHVGAAMGTSNKVFVTLEDGSLWQRWWNSSFGWQWHSHGNPFGWHIDSSPVALDDGKLFVTGDWDHAGGNTRTLLQLYYDGSSGQWQWFDHGRPPGTSIAEGGVAVNPIGSGGAHVIVKGTDGLFYMCYFDPNVNQWVWKGCGTPP